MERTPKLKAKFNLVGFDREIRISNFNSIIDPRFYDINLFQSKLKWNISNPTTTIIYLVFTRTPSYEVQLILTNDEYNFTSIPLIVTPAKDGLILQPNIALGVTSGKIIITFNEHIHNIDNLYIIYGNSVSAWRKIEQQLKMRHIHSYLFLYGMYPPLE